MNQNEARTAQAASGHRRQRHRTGNQIILNMPFDITFNVDEDAVKAGFYPVLN